MGITGSEIPLLGGIIAKALMLVEGILDLFVEGNYYANVGVCNVAQFTDMSLTGCGNELVDTLGSVLYHVTAMLQSIVGGLAATTP